MDKIGSTFKTRVLVVLLSTVAVKSILTHYFYACQISHVNMYTPLYFFRSVKMSTECCYQMLLSKGDLDCIIMEVGSVTFIHIVHGAFWVGCKQVLHMFTLMGSEFMICTYRAKFHKPWWLRCIKAVFTFAMPLHCTILIFEQRYFAIKAFSEPIVSR